MRQNFSIFSFQVKITNKIIIALVIFTVIFVSGIWVCRLYPVPLAILIWLQYTLCFYSVYKATVLNIFTIHCNVLGCLLHGYHLCMMNKFLTNHRRMQLRYLRKSQIETVRFLAYFRQQHSILVRDFLTTNQKVVADSVFGAFSIVFVVSICFITMLYFGHLHDSIKLPLSLLILVQTALLVFVTQPMIYAVGELHAPAKHFPHFQQSLQIKYLREKIKLMRYYELLNTNDKLYFTFGHLSEITTYTQIKFALFYMSQLMYYFKIIMRG